MRIRTAFVLSVFIALPLSAADSASLDALLRTWKAGNCDYGDTPPSVICVAIDDNGGADQVVPRIASKLRVSRESAALLAEAELRIGETRQRTPPTLDESIGAALDQSLRHAIDRELNPLPLVIVLADLTSARGLDVAENVLPLLLKSRDPIAAVMATADAFPYSKDAPALLSAALQSYPDNLDLLEKLAERRGSIGAAAGPARITADRAVLRDTTHGVASAGLAERARRQITDLAGVGLAKEARSLLEALPDGVQKSLLAKADLDSYQVDARLQLAAAYLLTGDASRARKIANAARKTVDPANEVNPVAQRILDAMLTPSKDDVFDLIVAASSKRLTGVLAQVYADLLASHDYPQLAAEVLRDHAESIGSTEEGFEDLPELQPINATLHADVRMILARAELLAPQPADSAATRRLLEQARLTPFVELPLPAEIVETATVIDCSDTAKVAQTTHLPPFVHPIRMERDGNDVVAIGISSSLDPTGELGLGGYWVLRSRDGGTTWTSLYTGLRENLPYVVLPASRLSMLAGDHLRIEVEVRELDLSSITFPPVGLRTARTAKGLYLDFPWAELERDRDSDGLTDLLEERIVTDPNAADTDGDGIADGRDSLPQVAMVPGRTARAEALAVATSDYTPGAGAIIPGLIDTEEAKNACVLRASLIGEATLFMIGDRAPFAPLDVPQRTIVLTRGEHELYEKKFGPTYGATIRNFVVDHSGTRVLIELNEAWKGETLLMTKTKNGWESTPISMWIS